VGGEQREHQRAQQFALAGAGGAHAQPVRAHAQVRGFRSLTATMCLAVTLVVSLGQYLESRSEPAGTRQRRLSNGTPVPESR